MNAVVTGQGDDILSKLRDHLDEIRTRRHSPESTQKKLPPETSHPSATVRQVRAAGLD
jgi:hypothetical protein